MSKGSKRKKQKPQQFQFRDLLSHKLPNGVQLEDATRAEVAEAAVVYRNMDCRAKARDLDLIFNSWWKWEGFKDFLRLISVRMRVRLIAVNAVRRR